MGRDSRSKIVKRIKQEITLQQIYRDAVVQLPKLLSTKTDDYAFGAEAFHSWANDMENVMDDSGELLDTSRWVTAVTVFDGRLNRVKEWACEGMGKVDSALLAGQLELTAEETSSVPLFFVVDLLLVGRGGSGAFTSAILNMTGAAYSACPDASRNTGAKRVGSSSPTVGRRLQWESPSTPCPTATC